MRIFAIGLPTAALCLTLSCEKEPASTTRPETSEPAVEVAAESEEGSAEEGAMQEAAQEEPATWATMDRKARFTYMGTVVFPAMKKSFQGHDEKQFADFKCQTCHGDDMKEVDFKMPNAITPLGAADPMQSGIDMDEAMAKYMADIVLPQMGEMLNMEADPKGEKGGVSCFTCHLKD